MKFKNREEINAYFQGDKIECLLCGKYFKALATHIIRTHEYTVDEYKKEFGLPWGRGLTSNDTNTKQSLIMKKRVKEDPRLKLTPELMNKAQQAKKRPVMEYRMNELSEKALKMTEEAKQKSIIGANQILDMMETEKLPACYTCLFDDLPDLYVLMGAMKHDKTTKKRYQAIKKTIPSLIELKSGLDKNKLTYEIKRASENGVSNNEIARHFNINKKTVAKYLAKK